jgi:hypothetical protein
MFVSVSFWSNFFPLRVYSTLMFEDGWIRFQMVNSPDFQSSVAKSVTRSLQPVMLDSYKARGPGFLVEDVFYVLKARTLLYLYPGKPVFSYFLCFDFVVDHKPFSPKQVLSRSFNHVPSNFHLYSDHALFMLTSSFVVYINKWQLSLKANDCRYFGNVHSSLKFYSILFQKRFSVVRRYF